MVLHHGKVKQIKIMMGLTLVIYVLLIMNISSRIVHFIKVGKSNIFLICLFITFINILNCLIN